MLATDMDDVAPGYVAIGRVLGAWGAHGDLKVEPLAPPKQLAVGRRVRLAGREAAISSSRRRGRFVVLKLEGIDVREEAAALRGQYLQAEETDLAPLGEGQYYRYQLIGLAVRGSDGRDLGRIADVLSTPESDVFVVRGPLGEVLVPAVDEIIMAVDVADGTMTVEIVPGLLPE